MSEETTQRARNAAILSLCSTLVVVAFKLVAAWLSGSISVLAEGLQSIVDVAMSLIAVFTVSYAARPPDAGHTYGHGKAEQLAGALQMILILGAGLYILFQAYGRWVDPQVIRVDWGIAAMGYAVVSNLFVSRHLTRVGKETGSAAVTSEALHLRGDTLSSFGVLIGLALVATTGYQGLDPIVAAVFAILSMVLAALHLNRMIHPLLDGALPPEEIATIEQTLRAQSEVRGFHNLRSRTVGSLRHLELHVMLDDALTFVQAHEIAEALETKLSQAVGGALVSIHYEPFQAEVRHRIEEHRGEF